MRGEVGAKRRVRGTHRAYVCFKTRGSSPSPQPSPREERGEGVHLSRGEYFALIATPLTSLSVPRGRCGTFPKECCFQVIYFVSNISFVAATEPSPRPPWKAFG